MLRLILCLSGLALCLSLPARPAVAQLDYRVDRADVRRDGRLLEANPMVGSNGLNSATSAGIPGFRSNAIISGNVTGLAAFKGASQIYDVHQFRQNLPSAGLSSFYRQSVGVGNLGTGGPPLPTYYLGAQESSFNVGMVRQGYTRHGATQYGSADLAPTVGVAPGGDWFRPVDTRAAGAAVEGAEPQFGVIQRDTAGMPAMPTFDTRPASPYSFAANSPIFGVNPPVPPSVQDVLRERGRVNVRQYDVESDGNGQPPVRPTAVPAPQPATVQTDWLSRAELGDPAAGTSGEVGESLDDGGLGQVRQSATADTGRTTRTFVGAGRAPSPAGTDLQDARGDSLYREMIEALRLADQKGVRQVDASGAPVTPGPTAPPPPVGDKADSPPPAANQSSTPIEFDAKQAMQRLASETAWARGDLADPVTSFIGRHRGEFNDYMARAEAALRLGQYYRAAELYELAETIAPENPLPKLGAGHALIASGDYRSAFHSIQAGIAIFPQIARFNLDLPALTGNRDIFDIRRAELEKLLEMNEQYTFRFLLGYVEHYSGLEDLGLENLRAAASQAPSDSPIHAFVEQVVSHPGPLSNR